MGNLLRCAAATLAMLAASLAAPAQSVTFHASHFGGTTSFTGWITLTPTWCNGAPASFHAGSGGQTTAQPLRVKVSAGAFSVSLPDTAAASPANAGYALTSDYLIGSGYGCIQTAQNNAWCTAGDCNFDNFTPAVSGIAAAQPFVVSINGVYGILDFTGSCVVRTGNTFDFSGCGWPGYPSGTGIVTVAAGSAFGAVYNASNQIPASFIPILNQNTTGTAAGLSAAYIDWNALSGGAFILNKPTLGTAASHATTDFDAAGAASSAASTVQAASLQKSANLSDVADAPTARTNLGLGTAATHPNTDFLSGSTVLAATLASVSHKWINSYSAITGLFTQTQPACADLSDAGSGCSSAAYTLPTASPTVLGGVKVDGSTINIAAGVISASPDFVKLAGGKILTNTYGCLDGYDHLPCTVASVNLTGQSANISPTSILASAPAGRYRYACQTIGTQPATTSSTLPGCQLIYTDPTTNTSIFTNAGAGSGGNAVGSNSPFGGVVDVKAATSVTFQGPGYASSGATPMQFKLILTLERVQ